MRNRIRSLRITIFAMLLAVPAVVFAQGSSINAFSPYTFYGIGDLTVQGPANLRSMGGAGVAFFSPYSVNSLNPASIGSMRRNSFLFNFEGEGMNVYAKSADGKTSYSTFNIRDVSIQLPLYEGMGFAFTMTPLSSVGYRVDMRETDPHILANVGDVKYGYHGSGNITQFKFSYGARIWKKLYLGADLIYYKGNINRNYNVHIEPVLEPISYNNTLGVANEEYSRIGGNFGVNYTIIVDPVKRRLLNFGATFQPKVNLNPKIENLVMLEGIAGDTISRVAGRKNFYLPTTFQAGLFYEHNKISATLDYVFQHWKGLNSTDAVNGIKFGNTNTVKAGLQYIPNANDFNSFLRRWSYRIGFRYSDYYMEINGKKINDYAITFGVGIPVKRSSTMVNVGVELGRRGNTATGHYGTKEFRMLRENYFKFSVGLSLFGEDYWFVKQKYD